MGIGIGVVLDQAERPGPGQRRFVQAIAEDPRFDLVMLTAAPPPPGAVPVLVDWFFRLERFVFPVPDRAARDIPEITAFPAHLPPGTDVVVDFSHSDAALELSKGASQGLWRLSAYHRPAGLAPARDREPFTRVALVSHRPGQQPEPLATARYDTKFLATRNAALIREKSVQMVVQALARLALTGTSAGLTEPVPAPRPFAPGDIPGYVFRTGLELAVRAMHAAGERLGRRPGMFELRLGEGDSLSFDPASGVTLEPPGNTFWADPFILNHADELFLFYEVFDYKTRRGHIDVGRIEGDRLLRIGTALMRPYHLSYPFVFRWNGEIWMIPETHAAERLELWRAKEFPTGWELAATAFEGKSIADTVVFERDGQWWLFTNICQDSYNDHGAELHIFRIDDPMLGKIEPHPLNPVVIDTTTARGGGRVFEKNGKLYRTSQDNSHGLYGFGLNLMEITRLDATGYEERRVRHVVGNFADGIMACHHMDAAAGRFVIDVRRETLGAPTFAE